MSAAPSYDDQIKILADEIYRDKVRRARQATFEQKFLAGPELFDYACSITRAGIRMQNPGATHEDVERILRDRLALQLKLEKSR